MNIKEGYELKDGGDAILKAISEMMLRRPGSYATLSVEPASKYILLSASSI